MAPAYHIVFGTYGFWLPNDPRGSCSESVGSWDLFRYGGATMVDTTASVAFAPHDRARRLEAKKSLKHPPVVMTGEQARSVGIGFGEACRKSGYIVTACAILPEHVHLVIANHPRQVSQIVAHLKGWATRRLIADGMWETSTRPFWAAKFWKVYLDSEDDVYRTVAYVEANPEKEGKPRQHWNFVRPVNSLAVGLRPACPIDERVSNESSHDSWAARGAKPRG